MNSIKVLCLGNEFIIEDSFAKKVAESLKTEMDNYNFIDIKDSFELIDQLKDNENIYVIDVVEGLNEVKLLEISDLRLDSIVSAHDFDAGFFLKLIGKNVKIIGIPIKGDINKVRGEVRDLLRVG